MAKRKKNRVPEPIAVVPLEDTPVVETERIESPAPPPVPPAPGVEPVVPVDTAAPAGPIEPAEVAPEVAPAVETPAVAPVAPRIDRGVDPRIRGTEGTEEQRKAELRASGEAESFRGMITTLEEIPEAKRTSGDEAQLDAAKQALDKLMRANPLLADPRHDASIFVDVPVDERMFFTQTGPGQGVWISKHDFENKTQRYWGIIRRAREQSDLATAADVARQYPKKWIHQVDAGWRSAQEIGLAVEGPGRDPHPAKNQPLYPPDARATGWIVDTENALRAANPGLSDVQAHRKALDAWFELQEERFKDITRTPPFQARARGIKAVQADATRLEQELGGLSESDPRRAEISDEMIALTEEEELVKEDDLRRKAFDRAERTGREYIAISVKEAKKLGIFNPKDPQSDERIMTVDRFMRRMDDQIFGTQADIQGKIVTDTEGRRHAPGRNRVKVDARFGFLDDKGKATKQMNLTPNLANLFNRKVSEIDEKVAKQVRELHSQWEASVAREKGLTGDAAAQATARSAELLERRNTVSELFADDYRKIADEFQGHAKKVDAFQAKRTEKIEAGRSKTAARKEIREFERHRRMNEAARQRGGTLPFPDLIPPDDATFDAAGFDEGQPVGPEGSHLAVFNQGIRSIRRLVRRGEDPTSAIIAMADPAKLFSAAQLKTLPRQVLKTLEDLRIAVANKTIRPEQALAIFDQNVRPWISSDLTADVQARKAVAAITLPAGATRETEDFVQDIKDRVERGELPPGEGQELINSRMFAKPPKVDEEKPLIGQAQAIKRVGELFGIPSHLLSSVEGVGKNLSNFGQPGLVRFDDPEVLTEKGITVEQSLLRRVDQFRREMKAAGQPDEQIEMILEHQFTRDRAAKKIWDSIRSRDAGLPPADATPVSPPVPPAKPVPKPKRPPAGPVTPPAAVSLVDTIRQRLKAGETWEVVSSSIPPESFTKLSVQEQAELKSLRKKHTKKSIFGRRRKSRVGK